MDEGASGQWLGIGWRSRHAMHRDFLATDRSTSIGPDAFTGIAGMAERAYDVPRTNFVGCMRGGAALTPQVGRFYPPAFLQGLQTRRPFRVLAVSPDTLRIDPSPALAGRALEALSVPIIPGVAVRKWAAASDPLAVLKRAGVGFQGAANETETEFGLAMRLLRADDGFDASFYSAPRLVHHLDAAARLLLADCNARLLGGLPDGAPVLDLMSSWTTHLPAESGLTLTGLGMNAAELAANPLLTERVLHDLNEQPCLPFPNRHFSAAICSLSVEYLVEPLAVFAELARVLRPGAPVVLSWTERWFPPKAVSIWSELHPYERVAMVVDCLRLALGWHDIVTESYRGLMRPTDDRYADQLPEADPLYLVRALSVSR
ncbi:MAG TPA: methyltransferase domain-containing protein [Rhodocyclaceae bacterium]